MFITWWISSGARDCPILGADQSCASALGAGYVRLIGAKMPIARASAEVRCGGGGAGNRRGIRRDLAQPGGGHRWNRVRRDDVLDAQKAVDAEDRTGGVRAHNPVRRMPRLSGVRAAPRSRPARREVRSQRAGARCSRANEPKGRRANWPASAPATFLGSHLCAARGARGAKSQIASAEAACERHDWPWWCRLPGPSKGSRPLPTRAWVLAARRGFVRGAFENAEFAPPFSARGAAAGSRRTDSTQARQARVEEPDRRHPSRARGLWRADQSVVLPRAA